MESLKRPMPKIIIIAIISILLLIPLAMIKNQIFERSDREHQVQSSIAANSASSQRLTGPVILLEYQEHIQKTEQDSKTGMEITKTVTADRQQLVAPQMLDIKGSADTEVRKRGIYKARLFHMLADIKADFQFELPEPVPNSSISDMQATLLLGISDPRGVNNNPLVSINGHNQHFNSIDTSVLRTPQLGIKLDTPEPGQPVNYSVSFTLNLTGTSSLGIAPVGNSNKVELVSDWPHPKFHGRFLPRQHQIDENGFSASWEISHLARDFRAATYGENNETLCIDFIDPVNIYLQAERATKYGILFVLLTFAAFFLTETLRQISLHPIQYLLVGLALAIFFLLLIAFSEHMPFIAAYGIAAASCIGIITWYLSGVLHKWQHGIAFGAGLTSMYGILYGVLNSEDNALLMGSLLLFVALGATMLTTRKLDWYAMSGRNKTLDIKL